MASAGFIAKATGISRKSVFTATQRLLAIGLLERFPDGESFNYGLIIEQLDPVKNLHTCVTVTQDPVKNLHTPPMKNLHTNKETDLKKGKKVLSESVQSQAQEIYSLYPKKVGRPKAIAAILKALRSEPFEDLRTATSRYAAAWKDALPEERQFCPHPATWFNQERYLDDPTTWKRSNGTAPAARGRAPQENPRNVGICKNTTDYGAAGIRKLQRQEADRLAREMAANETLPLTACANGQ